MRALLFTLLTLSTCSYAVWRGGAPERWVTCIFIFALTGTFFAPERFPGSEFQAFPVVIAAIDLLLLIALIAIALKADRFWTIPMAGLQLTTLLGHVLKMSSPDLSGAGYRFLMVSWSWPMIILLAIATFRHQGRVVQTGVDRSWKSS